MIPIPDKAWEDDRLSNNHFLVLLVLCHKADSHLIIDLSQTQLARLTRLHRGTVNRLLAELTDMGWISRIAAPAGGYVTWRLEGVTQRDTPLPDGFPPPDLVAEITAEYRYLDVRTAVQGFKNKARRQNWQRRDWKAALYRWMSTAHRDQEALNGRSDPRNGRAGRVAAGADLDCRSALYAAAAHTYTRRRAGDNTDEPGDETGGRGSSAESSG